MPEVTKKGGGQRRNESLDIIWLRKEAKNFSISQMSKYVAKIKEA